ncbi:ATP-binding protein [Candidatus Saccharibacteria bacterium]|nr:ATP-binding protein [Candidatus Saccharibacteria bacterium]
MIKREIEKKIREKLGKGKTIILFGARQVGKTTLLQEIFDKDAPHDEILWLNGDNDSTKDFFSVSSPEAYKSLLLPYKTVIIDEAQRIPDIGLKLKILQDNYGDKIQFVATGSSSFDLANKISEPLTGRKWTFWLPAFSLKELVDNNGLVDEKANLENRLVFGSYPAVVTNPESAHDIITELASDSLYRDVLSLGEIIKTDKLRLILKALAMQIGSQVSMNELAGLVGIDRKTVDKYISLLEQSFIIFRLPSFSRNLRNELKFSQKVYFYDIGIRNAIINDFRPIELRPDAGAVFENYIIAELKKKYYNDNIYFWRNTEQQEIDFVLERDGKIDVYEVKYNEKKNPKLPNTFEQAYHPASFKTINRENYLEIV